MDTAARSSPFLDAEAFLRTDQSEFGTAWRYELVRGAIVAHAAPSPEHGVILGNLVAEIHNRLRDHSDCRPEVGSGAAPDATSATPPASRTPHDSLRKVTSGVVRSGLPVGAQHKRQWDQKRADLQAVEGVQEIVEIYQDEMLAHAYQRHGAGWVFVSIAGPEAPDGAAQHRHHGPAGSVV